MLPAWPMFEHALDFRGAAYFVCVAETEDIPARNSIPIDRQGALTGRIFIIANRARWRSKTKKSLLEAISALDDLDAFPTTNSLQASFGETYAELLKNLAEHCSFQCKFYLRRNGVIDMWADADDKRAGDAPQYPTDHRQHAVVGQAYSFIRDVGHVHQHHSKTNDTIVDIHRIIDDDDIEWRRRTLYSFYRRIISFKRQSDIRVQIQCVGLIAYAKAFKYAWLEDRPRAKDEFEIPVFHDDAMKESIQASELRMRYKLQQSTERWSIFRTVSLALFGLLLSYSSLIKVSTKGGIDTPPSPILKLLASSLLTYPLQAVFIVGAAVLALLLLRSTDFKPQEWKIFRYLQALAQPLNRYGVFAIFAAVAVAITYFAIRLALKF